MPDSDETDRQRGTSESQSPSDGKTSRHGAKRADDQQRVVLPIGKREMAARRGTQPIVESDRDLSPEEDYQNLRAKLKIDSLAESNRLLRLPQATEKPSRSVWISFLLCVVLPTMLVGVYFFVFAADQYVAEFRFAVTETTPTLPGVSPSISAPGSSSSSGSSSGSNAASAAIGAALGSGGSSMMGTLGSSMQNFVVVDYLLSRQAVDELETRIKLREMYSKPLVKNDWWARFDPSLPIERFHIYWNRMASATFDPVTGIAVANVRAFTAQDALLIANTMVTLSEDLVNDIAKRPQLDAIRYSEGEVKRAQERLNAIRAELAEYRTKEGVIDPSGSVSGNVNMIQALRTQLIQLQTDLGSLGNQQQNPNNPVAQRLRAQIASTKDQLAQIKGEVAKNRDGSRVLTEVVSRYEQLDLDRQYAEAMIVSTQQALDQARANAAAQHLYLTPYVRPVLAESSTYPKRYRATLIVALSLFGIWFIGLMATRSIREHLY